VTTSRKLKLGVYLDNHGGHVASWRMPGIEPLDVDKLEYWQDLARLCERGKMDYLFLADSNRVQYQRNPQAMAQMAATPYFEPLTLLSALAACTDRLGLVATLTTTYNQPFTVARLFGSLDRISGGRASWNVVTSASGDEAPNFQADRHMPHDDRYARAREFLDIVLGLWDSWEDDAFVRDQASGVYLDHSKMHYLNHSTERFSVKGPLNLPRPPQGYPVIFQSGSSEVGRQFGAEKADALFTAQETKIGAKAYYDDVKGRTARAGRNPDQLVIYMGVSPIVGRTMDEAQERFETLQSNLTPDVSLQLLTEVLGIDVSKLPANELITDLPLSDGMQSRRDLLLAKAIKEKMTLLDLANFVAGGRGHRQILGTPQSIADDFQDWLESGVTDGFLLAPAYLPGALEDFVELVVPELQRRGIFRTEYEGKTLRENMGLPRPHHPAAHARS
jgi:FMN-dependent oxidoreductase (nitrilotriacetate monooxygenase family)